MGSPPESAENRPGNLAWKTTLWRQFGAAIDMLENAVLACPDGLWGDRSRRPEFWYLVFHTLFWLDCYLTDDAKSFAPPPPFTLSELDPAGVLPERVYAKRELLDYLEHGRRKCQTTLAALTEERARERHVFGSVDLAVGELHLYNLRHVQHGAAQLNLILRQTAGGAPAWVKRTSRGLDDDLRPADR
jgi:hypothetical protein